MNTNRTLWLLLFLSSLLAGSSLTGLTSHLAQAGNSSVEIDRNQLLAQNRGSSDATCVPGSGRRGCAIRSNTLDV